MAEALFRLRLGQQRSDWAAWRVESAGTWASAGHHVPPEVIYTLRNYGLDLSQHRSRPVSARLLAGFHLILTMEEGHKEAISIEFPAARSRVYLLTEMAGKQLPIEDPMGSEIQEFERTAQEIDRWLADGFARICQLAGAPPEKS